MHPDPIPFLISRQTTLKLTENTSFSGSFCSISSNSSISSRPWQRTEQRPERNGDLKAQILLLKKFEMIEQLANRLFGLDREFAQNDPISGVFVHREIPQFGTLFRHPIRPLSVQFALPLRSLKFAFWCSQTPSKQGISHQIVVRTTI